MLLVTINSSIVLISLPAIFRGIHLDPLEPGNVELPALDDHGVPGRLGRAGGDCSAGSATSTAGSGCTTSASWSSPWRRSRSRWTRSTRARGAMWLIVGRVVQGVGGAMIFANSTAILTDAFPAHQRGMALGINNVAAVAGSFLGLVIGGLLAEWDWRAVFWVSVPIAILGTVWGYQSLHDTGARRESEDGLVGQRDLRGRADRAAGRDHLRHPALRRPRDRLDQPLGGRRPGRGSRAAGRVRRHREPGRRTRCSRCTCSRSGRSRPATSPACWPPPPGAACSSC